MPADSEVMILGLHYRKEFYIHDFPFNTTTTSLTNFQTHLLSTSAWVLEVSCALGYRGAAMVVVMVVIVVVVLMVVRQAAHLPCEAQVQLLWKCSA